MVVKDNLWEYTPPPLQSYMGVSRVRAYPVGLEVLFVKETQIKLVRKQGHIGDIDAWSEILFLTLFFIGTIIIHHKNESEFFFSKLWLMRLLFYFWWICFHSRFEILLNVRSYCWNLMLLRWSCNVKSRLIAATICKFTCLNLNTSKRKPSL